MRVANKNKAIGVAFDELKILSLDKEQRAIYQSKLKFLRDNAAEKEDARQEGEERGRQEGRQEGMQELLALWESGVSLSEVKKKFRLKEKVGSIPTIV